MPNGLPSPSLVEPSIIMHRPTICFLAFLLAGISPACAHAKPSEGFPDTKAGRHLEGWLQCLNESSQDKRALFLAEQFTEKGESAVARRQEFMAGARRMLGRAKLAKILRSNQGAVEAVVHGETGKSIKVVIKTSDAPPNGIESVMMAPFSDPKQKPVRRDLSTKEAVEELTAFLDSPDNNERFSGAVLLARSGDVLLNEAYGLASRRFDIPNNADTKFNIGSMNKMFTAVAVLQLVEQGQLSLDDRLSKHLGEDWLPKEVTSRIQIRHLLSHTSGLGSYFNSRFDRASRARFRELDSYKPLVQKEEPEFEPGQQWRYSNTGMLLLGVVIEKVTGASYFEYVRDNIYKKAGMLDTDCFDMDEPVPNLAMGYYRKGDDWRNNLFLHVVRGGPAGGGYSTTEDLHRFSQALLDFELLSPEYTRQLLTPKPNSPNYGYGFETEMSPSGLVAGHSGGFPGIEAKLEMYLDSGFVVVVLANQDDVAAPVLEKIRQLIVRVQ